MLSILRDFTSRKKISELPKHQGKSTPICTPYGSTTGAPLHEQYSIGASNQLKTNREKPKILKQSCNKVYPNLAPDFLRLSPVLGAYQKLSNLDNDSLLI